MGLTVHSSEHGEAPGPLARFGQAYDELARLAGVPLWEDLPEAQKLAIVAAARARHCETAADDHYLTARQVAELLGVSASTVGREIAAGRLPVVEVRGSRRIRRTVLEAYVDRQSEAMSR